MHFTKANENDVLKPKYKLEKDFEDFMNLGVKCAKVTLEPGRYKSTSSAIAAIAKGLERWRRPIKVFMHKGEIYLVRTDM